MLFPGSRTTRNVGRGGLSAASTHGSRGGTLLSWVRPTHCSCCGRPTLRARAVPQGEVLCSRCNPPSVA